MVNGVGDYMDLAEVTASDQQDPDSKPADGVDTDHDNFVVDDPDDDGQDISIVGIPPTGITAFLKDKK